MLQASCKFIPGCQTIDKLYQVMVTLYEVQYQQSGVALFIDLAIITAYAAGSELMVWCVTARTGVGVGFFFVCNL